MRNIEKKSFLWYNKLVKHKARKDDILWKKTKKKKY